MKVKMSGGALLAAVVLAVLAGVAALNWLGSHAAAIRAGAGTLVLVLVVTAAVAAAAWLIRGGHAAALAAQLARRHAPAPPPAQTVTAETLAVTPAAPAAPVAAHGETLALDAGRPVSYTINVTTAEAAAELARHLAPPQPPPGKDPML